MDTRDGVPESPERRRVALLASLAVIDREIAVSRREVHKCPVCGRGVTHAATLCGFCTKRGPGPAQRLWPQKGLKGKLGRA
jgi:hypothetical protein